HIGGRPGVRLAALDPVTGALDPGFTPPRLDGVVRALGLSPDGKVLYVGGDFTAVTAADGTVDDRPHIAALDAATGSLTSWLPPKDAGGRYYGHTGAPDKSRPGGVYAIAPSADGTNVHVGGAFLAWGGHCGPVSVDGATGQPGPARARARARSRAAAHHRAPPPPRPTAATSTWRASSPRVFVSVTWPLPVSQERHS